MYSKTNVYDYLFFSPHLDDAILSSGGFISKLISHHKKVLIITFFTEGDDTIKSADILSFLQSSNEESSHKLFLKRKQEDKQACDKIGADFFYCNFKDAFFRSQRGKPLYPDFKKLFSGNIHKQDNRLICNLKKTIRVNFFHKISPRTKIFTCLGIGNHIDHVITSNSIQELFPKTFFWQDVPYDSNYLHVSKRLKTIQSEKAVKLKKKIVFIQRYSSVKLTSVKKYSSQYPGLLRAGLEPRHFYQEIFYL